MLGTKEIGENKTEPLLKKTLIFSQIYEIIIIQFNSTQFNSIQVISIQSNPIQFDLGLQSTHCMQDDMLVVASLHLYF